MTARPTDPYQRAKFDAEQWLAASYDAKQGGRARPPVPDPAVSPADQAEYDRGWNEEAAKMNNPLAAAFYDRSRRDPKKWAHYVALCNGVGVSPWPESVDPARVMREPAYAHGSALAAGLRLDFTRRVWPELQ